MVRPTITQYTVRFPEGRGGVPRLTSLLARAGVNVRAMVSANVAGEDVVQFLARKDADLRERLERAGLQVREQQIFQLELANNHWELHKLAQALADNEIGVLSFYSEVADGRLKVILAVDETANAVALADRMGFEPDYAVC